VRLESLTADAQVAWYSRIVHAGQVGLVEVVRATSQDDGQLHMRARRDPRHYLDAGGAYALCHLAGMARGRGEEVFYTPMRRERAEPGKRAVGPGSVVWVDIDAADGSRLREMGRLNRTCASPPAPASTLIGTSSMTSRRPKSRSSTLRPAEMSEGPGHRTRSPGSFTAR
jgi:hypothetical protein